MTNSSTMAFLNQRLSEQPLTSAKPTIPLPSDIDIENYDFTFALENLSYFHASQDWTSDRYYIPTSIVLGLAFFIGMIGNLFVIFVMASGKKTRQSVTSTILASLALSDVIFLSVCVPYEILSKNVLEWPGGKALCKMAFFIETLSSAASAFNLTAVSIERYAVIVHPVKSRSWCTVSRTQKFAAVIWISALLVGSPVLFVVDLDRGLYYDATSYVVFATCGNKYPESTGEVVFVWYQLFVMFILPVCVMTLCYSLVIFELWFSTKQLDVLTQSVGNRPYRKVKENGSEVMNSGRSGGYSTTHRCANLKPVRKQVIKMLLTIISLFFICWGPKWIANVIKRHNYVVFKNEKGFVIMLIINLLPFIHSCFNPLVYSFMSTNFRRSVRDTFHRVVSASVGHNPTGSRTGIELVPPGAGHLHNPTPTSRNSSSVN